MSKLDDSVDLSVSGDGFQFEEELLCGSTEASAEDNEFDEIVGAIQEVLMDDSFTEVQDNFFDRFVYIL